MMRRGDLQEGLAAAPRAPARRRGPRPSEGGDTAALRGFRCRRLEKAAQLRRGRLDRHTDEGAPFRPRAVVVPDTLVAEQVLQDEPGVRAPLADPAVGDRLAPRIDALAAVDRAELVGRLEAAVLRDRGRPGDVLRAGDVAAALRAFLREVLGREQLARVLLG